MSAAGAAKPAVVNETFWQKIGDDIKAGWADVEAFGKEVVTDAETILAPEAKAVETAIVGVALAYVPKQLAVIRGWVVDYMARVTTGQNPFNAAVYCIGQDAIQEGQFLKGELSAELQAVAAIFMANPPAKA